MRARRWNTVSDAKLVSFVRTNPGLTASMIAILWRRPYGTISSSLYELTKAGKLSRSMEKGMRGGVTKAWRYYDGIFEAAINGIPKI